MKKRVTEPITEKDICEFISQANQLSQCTYLKNPIKKIEITYDMEKGLKFGGDIPNRESIDSFLMILRPFIEYEERLHVGRIISYLMNKYGNNEVLTRARSFMDAKSEFPIVNIGDKSYDANGMTYLYLYGKYFHLDPEKQEAYRLIEENLGLYGEYTALSHLERFAGIVLMVGGFIKRQVNNPNQNADTT